VPNVPGPVTDLRDSVFDVPGLTIEVPGPVLLDVPGFVLDVPGPIFDDLCRRKRTATHTLTTTGRT
jgi:hypothetical protein